MEYLGNTCDGNLYTDAKGKKEPRKSRLPEPGIYFLCPEKELFFYWDNAYSNQYYKILLLQQEITKLVLIFIHIVWNEVFIHAVQKIKVKVICMKTLELFFKYGLYVRIGCCIEFCGEVIAVTGIGRLNAPSPNADKFNEWNVL